MKMTVAVAQATPVVLDLAACVAKGCEWIGEAGKRGAQVLAFPETWIPVYPLCATPAPSANGRTSLPRNYRRGWRATA